MHFLPHSLRRALLWAASLALALTASAQRQMENLGRGVVAIRQDATKIFVSWRLLGTDPDTLTFNLYRATDNGVPVKLNAQPLAGATNYVDANADATKPNAYFVHPVLDGREQEPSVRFTVPAGESHAYLSIPLQPPEAGTTPDGLRYTYNANDASAADLDGDGEYEIILKWDPSNSRDNAFSGFTGNVFIDAYKLDGTRLWRIDLGKNIRAGAHYTQFMVYDLDGDGRAEMVCKTADGTVDGAGKVIGDAKAEWRETEPTMVDARDRTGSRPKEGGGYQQSLQGRIFKGPEFLTVFEGTTGRALATADYVPALNGKPEAWGDAYGNRSERYNACIAYLDGVHPSVVMCRGYYYRATLAAWDWRGGKLSLRWLFDSKDGNPENDKYGNQGNHGLSVADVDGDGKDDIVYGACTIGSNGKGLYSTGLGHGDALHVSDLDPARPGLEVFAIHENPRHPHGTDLRDARTGEILWSKPSPDVGRGIAADIDPRYPGYETWASGNGLNGLWDIKGNVISERKPRSANFKVWWDGDLLCELLNGNAVTKWNWETSTETPLLTAQVCKNHGLEVAGWVFNDHFMDYEEEIVCWTGIPALFSVPFMKEISRETVYREGCRLGDRVRNQLLPPSARLLE